MKVKKKGIAPPDDRVPVPLSVEDMAKARASSDRHERRKIHRILLVESLRRLRAGRQVERSHGVIHPEMTCIIRDTLRLSELVFPEGSDERQSVEVEAAASEVLETLGMRAVEELVARGGVDRVARAVGVSAKVVGEWRRGAKPDDPQRQAAFARLRIPVTAWDEPVG